jgi:hypothetical protein
VSSAWVHLGGEDADGTCLTCVLQASLSEWESGPIPHDVWPDPDSDDDDIWCGVCGHTVGPKDVAGMPLEATRSHATAR